MTREEKLYTMTGNTLLGLAEKLGINVNKNILKQGKSKLIEKILVVEAADNISTETVVNNNVETAEAPVKPEDDHIEAPVVEADKNITTPTKRANLKLTELTYNGETKSIKEWAAEINMPWPTLYDRVNRNGWPVDLAIETPLGQRRPK